MPSITFNNIQQQLVRREDGVLPKSATIFNRMAAMLQPVISGEIHCFTAVEALIESGVKGAGERPITQARQKCSLDTIRVNGHNEFASILDSMADGHVGSHEGTRQQLRYQLHCKVGLFLEQTRHLVPHRLLNLYQM